MHRLTAKIKVLAFNGSRVVVLRSERLLLGYVRLLHEADSSQTHLEVSKAPLPIRGPLIISLGTKVWGISILGLASPSDMDVGHDGSEGFIFLIFVIGCVSAVFSEVGIFWLVILWDIDAGTVEKVKRFSEANFQTGFLKLDFLAMMYGSCFAVCCLIYNRKSIHNR